jgi:hypothetical protein
VTYDRLGRKTDLKDPDLGWLQYSVDPPGRVWKQINPVQRKNAAIRRAGAPTIFLR